MRWKRFDQMITEKDKATIRRIARKYRAKRILLFGSGMFPEAECRDIDLGVEGVEDKEFFAFYGELLCALSKPVDVVDLSVKSRFSDMVRQEGVVVYA